MIEWNETRAILARASELTAAGRPAAIATVVRIQGSAYRRPGARFLVDDRDETLGSVSGGCLEADVRQVAVGVMDDQTPRLLHYDTGGEGDSPWGLGLGCEGAVDVFVQSAAPVLDSVGPRMMQLLDGDEGFVVATVVSGPEALGATMVFARADLGNSQQAAVPAGIPQIYARAGAVLSASKPTLEALGDHLVFLEPFVPAPQLLVCGAGDDAMPLVRYAAEAGFRVTVADHRAGFLTANRFPSAHRLVLQRPEAGLADLNVTRATYAVVMAHSLSIDREWIGALIGSPVPYIGLLGPRDRGIELLGEISEADRDRIYGPVGLDLGADGPSQVAMSILAEVMTVHTRREPRSLRDRMEPIHAQ